MNNKVEASDERSIRVFRGDEELLSGSKYLLAESLTVSISDPSNQYVYEAVGGAVFLKGGCSGRRIANKPEVTLVMPTAGDEEIKIVAGSFIFKHHMYIGSTNYFCTIQKLLVLIPKSP